MSNKLCREPKWPKDGIQPTTLFSTNSEVGNFNERELNKLSGKSYYFIAKDEEIIAGSLRKLLKDCLAREKLELKVGTQVMLIKNW